MCGPGVIAVPSRSLDSVAIRALCPVVSTAGGCDAAFRRIGRFTEDNGDLRCRRRRQSAPISAKDGASDTHGHFVGPSLTFEVDPLPEHEIEIGVAALRRIGGDGPREALRLFVQLSF